MRHNFSEFKFIFVAAHSFLKYLIKRDRALETKFFAIYTPYNPINVPFKLAS